MKINSRYNAYLIVKDKVMKQLKSNTEVHFYDIGESKHFLNRVQIVLTTKEKTERFNYIDIRNFHPQKITLRE